MTDQELFLSELGIDIKSKIKLPLNGDILLSELLIQYKNNLKNQVYCDCEKPIPYKYKNQTYCRRCEAEIF